MYSISLLNNAINAGFVHLSMLASMFNLDGGAAFLADRRLLETILLSDVCSPFSSSCIYELY